MSNKIIIVPKKLKKIPGKSLVESAYQEIKGRILSNDYGPGFQILETELADELGVSRTPLREAVKRLESEGFVQVIPRHGIRVIPLSAEDMQEIYEVLASLECTASELLAKQNPGDEKLEPMTRAMVSMEAALENDDLEKWAVEDDLFHSALLTLCGNKKLCAVAEGMREQSHRARMFTLRLRPKPSRSNEEHRELLEAIRAGDAAKARKIHEDHRAHTGTLISEILAKYKLSMI